MKSVALRWLLVTLAVVGLVLAVLVVFDVAHRDDFLTTTWYVLLADVYIAASLATRERWIRWLIWGFTTVATLVSMLYTWQHFDTWSRWNETGTQLTPYGVMSNLNITLHSGVVTLVLLALFSRAYPHLVGHAWLRAMYWATVAAALGAWGLWSITNFVYASTGTLWQASATAVTILAATFAAVVIIGAIALASKARSARASDVSATLDVTELTALVQRLVDSRLAELGVIEPQHHQRQDQTHD